MKINKIVIGGVPAPIGGVTTYLRRLLHRDCDNIDVLLDFYPGHKEPLRDDCQSKLVQVNGKLGLLKWLWTKRKNQVGRELFFNFSTPRSLLLFCLIPKQPKSHWSLMLHHGELKGNGSVSSFLYRVMLSRFNKVFSLSDKQADFYRAFGVSQDQLFTASSYCEPADHQDDREALHEFENIRKRFKKIILMSGFPKSLYNFQLGIDAVAALDRSDCALCLFIYGPGELRGQLKSLADGSNHLFVYDSMSERYFNTFLCRSDLLMRLTTAESFGISVWDAYYWERNIVASDVCKRPPTSCILDICSAQQSDNIPPLVLAIKDKLRV